MEQCLIIRELLRKIHFDQTLNRHRRILVDTRVLVMKTLVGIRRDGGGEWIDHTDAGAVMSAQAAQGMLEQRISNLAG